MNPGMYTRYAVRHGSIYVRIHVYEFELVADQFCQGLSDYPEYMSSKSNNRQLGFAHLVQQNRIYEKITQASRIKVELSR